MKPNARAAKQWKVKRPGDGKGAGSCGLAGAPNAQTSNDFVRQCAAFSPLK